MTAINDREREEIQAEVLARWLQHRETGQGGFSRETSVGIDIGSEGVSLPRTTPRTVNSSLSIIIAGASRPGGSSPSYPASAADDTEVPDTDCETAKTETGDANQNQVATRSKWQAVLLEAGGLSAAVSEESMRRLKYCLQWLQVRVTSCAISFDLPLIFIGLSCFKYATSHIDRQILLLRSFIESISPPQDPSSQQDPDALVPMQSMQTLTDVKKDLVSTIRQVVDVVSKYAGGTLPEPARSTVRAFILRLPERWAVAARAEASAGSSGGGSGSGTGQRRSRSETEAQERQSRPTASAATQAAQRVLTLATESLDTMRSVTGVFKDSLDRAEA